MDILEQKLIQQCINGDTSAWEKFVNEYSQTILSAIYRTLHKYSYNMPEDDIQDIKQQIVLSLIENDYKKLKQYSGINNCSFSTWLSVVVMRSTINFIKKISRANDIKTNNKYEKEKKEDKVNPNNIIKPMENSRHIKWDPVGDDGSYADGINNNEQVSMIREIIQSGLKPREILFMRLHFEKELTIPEIAPMMNMSRNAVDALKFRILKKIKEIFCKKYPSELSKC